MARAARPKKVPPTNTDTDDHRIIKVVGNAPFRQVLVYPETVRKVGLGHPEVPIGMPFIDDAIDNAIVNVPELQESHGSTYIIVDRESTDQKGQPLRVSVSMYKETDSARWTSAYFAHTEAEGDDE